MSIIYSALSVRKEADLLAVTQRLASWLGYDKVLFGIQLNLPLMKPVQHIVSGYPLPYQHLYAERRFLACDPTVVHCQTKTDPLPWEESMYNRDSFELMEESRRFGLGYGMSLPVHHGNRAVSMLSLARDKPFTKAEWQMAVEYGSVLAASLHVAAEAFLVPELLSKVRPPLSPREREVLQLLAIGKNNGEIADILQLSEHTVVSYVKAIFAKLDVTSRTQAAVIACALGILE